MATSAAQKLWLAAGLFVLVGAIAEDSRGGAGAAALDDSCGQPSEDEENAEAEAASTLLLQQAAHHSRVPVQRGGDLGMLSVDERGGVAAERSLPARGLSGTQLGGAMLASPYTKIVTEILEKREQATEDPFWAYAIATLRGIAELSPDAINYMNLCNKGDLFKYNATGCATTAEGSIVVNGSAADAYFCGNPGIDWSKAPFPRNDICSQTPGTAYHPDGHCGRHSNKTLAVNFATTVPNWRVDIYLVNVPSIDCILGLGNCDIYYCQHCPGRCN